MAGAIAEPTLKTVTRQPLAPAKGEARPMTDYANGSILAPETSGRHQVLVVGGGCGGVNVAKALADADVDVTIADRTNHHLFQPLLY